MLSAVMIPMGTPDAMHFRAQSWWSGPESPRASQQLRSRTSPRTTATLGRFDAAGGDVALAGAAEFAGVEVTAMAATRIAAVAT